MKLSFIHFVLIISSINLVIPQKSVVEASGDILQVAIPASAFISTLILNDDNKSTLEFAKIVGTTFIITHFLKNAIDKERPNGGRHSFPSGHTSSAFSGAAFVQKKYGWHVGIPAYLLAGYVGWSRVKASKHDYMDVISGTIIGIYTAYIFTKPQDKKSIKFTFSKSDNTYLAGFTYNF